MVASRRAMASLIIDGTVSRIGQAIFVEGILPVFHKTRGTTLCWPALAALSTLLALDKGVWTGPASPRVRAQQQDGRCISAWDSRFAEGAASIRLALALAFLAILFSSSSPNRRLVLS